MSEAANNQAESKKKPIRNLFDDLSVAQVLAGALAAVTSMLLASQIGIYGSVIGVGVGSVISAVASQVYKKFLSASADKIREVGRSGETVSIPPTRAGRQLGDSPGEGERASEVASQVGGRTSAISPVAEACAQAIPPSGSGHAAETVAMPVVPSVGDSGLPEVSSADAPRPSSAETVVMPAVPAAETVAMKPIPATAEESGGRSASAAAPADSQLFGDADRVRARAASQRKERVKRRVLAVSVVSALIAVAICAAVIMLVTQGEGVGAKPQHLVSSGQNAVVQEDQSDDASSSESASGSQGGEGTSQGSSSSTDEEGSSQDSSSGAESNSSSQGSSSSEGSSQGSSSGSGSSEESGSTGSTGSTDQGSEDESSSGSDAGGSASDGGSDSSSGSVSSDSESQESGAADGTTDSDQGSTTGSSS